MFEFLAELVGGLLWFWTPSPRAVRILSAVFAALLGVAVLAVLGLLLYGLGRGF